MACAILERTSGLEPSSETTAPRYLKLVTSALLPFLSLDAIGAVCHQFGLLCTDLHLIPCAGFVGLLAPALPQLEHLCHRQTTDW